MHQRMMSLLTMMILGHFVCDFLVSAANRSRAEGAAVDPVEKLR